MAQNFLTCDRDQVLLMPPSLGEWLPQDHLAWRVLAAVEEMDLSGFYAAYRQDGHGRPAPDPAMMVALLLYAYAKGKRPSQGIERECVEDIAYRVIAANQAPDHTTIRASASGTRPRSPSCSARCSRSPRRRGSWRSGWFRWGYWHQAQMETIVGRGIPVLIPSDASKRKGARPGRKGRAYAFMRRVLATGRAGGLYRKRQAMIESGVGARGAIGLLRAPDSTLNSERGSRAGGPASCRSRVLRSCLVVVAG